jgi:DNA-binding MurR/RpiR family transcriptional regulator
VVAAPAGTLSPPDVGARRALSELRGLLPSLTDGDKQAAVIAYVLAHPSHVGRVSITELAVELGVSESTIVKVCKKVGLDGFRDLKRLLRERSAVRADAIPDEIDASDDLPTVVQKLFANAIEDLRDTLATLDLTALGRAVAAVAQAERVACYGVGGSGPLALDAHHKFLLTGYRSEAYTDSHLAAMSAAMLGPRDVALVFSYSGETRAMNAVVRVAKRHGAATIGITSHRHTTLTKLADVSLFASAREQPITGENSTVRLVQKLVLDCLFACVIKDDQARVQEAFTRSTSAIREV